MKELMSLLYLPSIVEIVTHSLLWILIFWLCFHLSLTTDLAVPNTIHVDKLYYGMPLNILVFYINYIILLPSFMVSRPLWYFFFTIILLCTTSILESIIDGFTLIVRNDISMIETLTSLFFVNLIIHTVYLLISIAFRLSRDWFTNIILQRKIKNQQNEMELALLKSRIKPHFLFNTLNTLYSSAYEYGDEITANGIGHLSHLLRYMLYETSTRLIPLENEVDHLQNYIDLQKMRFMDGITVSFNVFGNISNRKVAPMIFITLVENAFKHGISTAQHSTINIDINVTSQKIELQVENDILQNKIQLGLNDDVGGLGLENLKKQLSLLYPQKHQLTIKKLNGRYNSRLELT